MKKHSQVSPYDEIYELYASKLYYYCFKLTKDTYMAEDLTQQTFLKAMEKLHTFKNESSILTWLCTIAKNEFINQLNKNKRLTYEKILDIYHENDVTNVEDIVLSKHTIRKLARIIKGLDEPFREIFILRVYNEMSFKEIGSLYNKSDIWARVNYHRAREKIKNKIENNL